ncbi:MAG: hypothetical protein Q8N84_04235 [bacterium]|nr:hypothetical protein [bacterium]
MTEKIGEKVEVACQSLPPTGRLTPTKLRWRGREYPVEKIGLHFPLRQGKTLHHIFSIVAGGNFFKLDFDTESLVWTLEEAGES